MVRIAGIDPNNFRLCPALNCSSVIYLPKGRRTIPTHENRNGGRCRMSERLIGVAPHVMATDTEVYRGLQEIIESSLLNVAKINELMISLREQDGHFEEQRIKYQFEIPYTERGKKNREEMEPHNG